MTNFEKSLQRVEEIKSTQKPYIHKKSGFVSTYNPKYEQPHMSEYEFEKFCMDDYNSQEGEMHLIDNICCDKCKNKGYIADIEEYDNGITKHYRMRRNICECMISRINYRSIKNNSIGSFFYNKTSKDYIVTKKWQIPLKGSMVAYLKRYIMEEHKYWYAIFGCAGCGKTTLCGIILNVLAVKYKKDFQIIHWGEFIGKTKRYIMQKETLKAQDMIDSIKYTEVLFIDELLSDKYTEVDIEYAKEILDYRYKNNLITIINSQRTFNELLKINEPMLSRVFEKTDKGRFLIDRPKIEDVNMNYRLGELGGENFNE